MDEIQSLLKIIVLIYIYLFATNQDQIAFVMINGDARSRQVQIVPPPS